MNIINLIIMIALISLLVLVHEWGHYIAARLFGVRVTKFGFGMPIGPVLFKTKKGDLEILVHACLLGGYVSFPEDEETEQGEPLLPPDSKERFKNQTPLKQAIIVTAGVIMNVIFAFFLIVLAATIFHKLPTGKSEVFINEVLKDGYIQKTMPNKLKANDKIVSVNGIDIDSAYSFIFLVKNSKLYDNKVSKETINKKLDEFLKLNPKIKKNEIIKEGTRIILPTKTPEDKLVVNEHILKGIEKYKDNEIQLSEDETKLRNELLNRYTYVLTRDSFALEIATALADYYKPLDIVIERGGKQIEIKNVVAGEEGTLGVKLSTKEIYTETKTLPQIFVNSAKYMVNSTKLMCIGLIQLITGKIPMNEMHGIIAITKIGSDIIEHQGMLNGLLLTAIISIDLAIINLLPIPALDGGHLMFIIVEKIIGRPLDEKIVENISRFFFALLIALMIFVVFNDIFALITKKF